MIPEIFINVNRKFKVVNIFSKKISAVSAANTLADIRFVNSNFSFQLIKISAIAADESKLNEIVWSTFRLAISPFAPDIVVIFTLLLI